MTGRDETERLEKISAFYQKGDLMDELSIEREVDLLKRFVNPDGRAIEIGCGNGYLTERLVKISKDLYILEPSKQNLELMSRRVKLPENRIFNSLLEDFATELKFEEIFFLNILEHVEEPIESLKKAESLLTDEGKIYISVPNCMSLNRRAGFKMGLLPSYSQFAPKDIEVGHRRLYTVKMLTDHINSAGLRIEALKGIYLKPLAESQMFNLGMEAIKAFHLLGEDIPEYCATLFAVARKINY